MLSIYVPFVSTGTVANPRACVGDSLYEWVVNSAANTLSKIRKDTYALIETVSIPTGTTSTTITLGTYQGTAYIFTSSFSTTLGSTAGNIHRVSMGSSSPTTITITKSGTGPDTNVACSVITYMNGYLWAVPYSETGVLGTILRLNIFSNFYKVNYTFTSSNTDDSELTVYTGINTINSNNPVRAIYVFGNYVFILCSGTTPTVITKLSTLIPTSSGVVDLTNSIIQSIQYSSTPINSIASDNVNYIWMAESQPNQGMIYRMSINYTLTVSAVTPTVGVGGILSSFSSTLKNVTTIKYGAGYLWVAGTSITTNAPSLVQIDVTSETIITTIPLISTTTSGVTNPANSSISNIDIYNEYMWLTDTANSALLKMKIYIPCFKEGTKILCLNAQMKEEYIPVENIRKGHLVKTSLNGFVPVSMIGRSFISNPGTDERIKNRLYKCTKNNYPELFEDLYITGCHSILVDELTEVQKEQTLDALGDIFITDRKYRLMAYLDEKSEPYAEIGTYTIWHFALENDNYFMNYGVYANGLLVESTSKRYMKELSGMELIE